MVRARIAANRPGSAASRGVVTVDFAVSDAGAVTLVQASGPGELARSVEAAVRRAAPFPPPPPGAPRRFRMTFTFR
jgi:protein TonB